jgi:hypothetical protein
VGIAARVWGSGGQNHALDDALADAGKPDHVWYVQHRVIYFRFEFVASRRFGGAAFSVVLIWR